MKKTVLREYARLIAVSGANVQKGQEVEIFAGLDQPEFIRMLVEECYKAGAGKVTVDWDYQPLEKLHVRWQKQKVLNEIPDWQMARLEHRVKVLPARIYIDSEDPDGLRGINMKKYTAAGRARGMKVKPVLDKIEGKYQWCIAAVPGKAWAKKVFPDLSPAAAVERLWQAILEASRALGDAVANWQAHDEDLDRRCEYLNSLHLDSLHYEASNGTNFTVWLIEGGLFLGGAEKLKGSDLKFNPNIPSEEVFTTPMKGRAEGIVYASKPLSFNGNVIEDFWIRFENGKVAEMHAEKNEEALKSIIEYDEAASYLGEAALVPYHSPISESGILYQNTLFDENAACHLALGRGFENTLEGYEDMTLEECHEKGVNDSIVHVDFMIGTEDLHITGKGRDGKVYEIFRDGDWAF